MQWKKTKVRGEIQHPSMDLRETPSGGRAHSNPVSPGRSAVPAAAALEGAMWASVGMLLLPWTVHSDEVSPVLAQQQVQRWRDCCFPCSTTNSTPWST